MLSRILENSHYITPLGGDLCEMCYQLYANWHTVEQAEEVVCVLEHCMQRVVTKLIFVILVPISGCGPRISHAHDHPHSFLCLEENLENITKTSSD